MRTMPGLVAAALATAVILSPACRGRDPVEPAHRALTAYASAIEAFASRADAVADAAAAAAAVEKLADELLPVAASIRALGREYPDLGNAAAAPPRLKPDIEAADEAGGRLAAAMAKVMSWGDAPAVRLAVARLAAVEARLQ